MECRRVLEKGGVLFEGLSRLVSREITTSRERGSFTSEQYRTDCRVSLGIIETPKNLIPRPAGISRDGVALFRAI